MIIQQRRELADFWQFEQTFQLVSYLLQEESSPLEHFVQKNNYLENFSKKRQYCQNKRQILEAETEDNLTLFRVSSVDKAAVHRAIHMTQVGLIAVSLSGQVEYFNPAIVTLWQLPHSVLSTRQFSDYVDCFKTRVNSPKGFYKCVEQIAAQPLAAGVTAVRLADGRVFEQGFQSLHIDGKVAGRLWGYIESKDTAEPKVASSPSVVTLESDAVRLKYQRDYLYQQMVSTEAITQKKLQLTAQIIHRSLSSLNVVSMTSGLIERYYGQWSESRKKKYLGQVKAAFNQINKCISRLEEIAQIGMVEGRGLSAYKDPLSADKITTIDPYKVCCDLVENFKTAYKQHTFVALNATSLNVALSGAVSADANYVYESLLKAILIQLLENASQYSSSSLVKVILIEAEDSMTLQVHDTGIGVLPAEREHVFEPFYRGSNIGDVEGIGIGLTLVKALSEALCGQVKLFSELGEGTRIKVVLPVMRSPILPVP